MHSYPSSSSFRWLQEAVEWCVLWGIIVNRKSIVKLMSVVLLGLWVAACQTTTTHKPTNAVTQIGGATVVVMPFDVELSELTAGGLNEPRADWTQQAEGNLKRLLNDRLGNYSVKVIQAEDLAKDDALISAEKRVIRFHSVVGGNILQHKFMPLNQLPTKKDRFDWTLGEKVELLRSNYDADYALFLFVRDSYSSAGRAAVIAFGALLGVGIQGGQQVGYASLVDLNSGKIEWFNFLHSSTGDLRKEEGAVKAVEGLLSDFPS